MYYNIIPVRFYGRHRATAPEIMYQYDQKQVFLPIDIPDLPQTFRVDFCNEGDTTTKPVIGTPEGIEIPDEYLLSGEPVLAYFVLSEEDGAVQTRYEIYSTVWNRKASTDVEPTPEQQTVIDQLIAELNAGVAAAQAAAENAARSAQDAQTAASAFPRGGTRNQVLKKRTSLDFDAYWGDESGGGGGNTDFWFGTRQEYNSLPYIDPAVCYCIEEGT